MASSTEHTGPYRSTLVTSPKTKKGSEKTETTATEQALNSTATTQYSDVAKPGIIEKAKTGQQRGRNRHDHRIVGKPTGNYDFGAIRQILNEALEGGPSTMKLLHQKVQELIESKQRDTVMIEQLKQKTEELLMIIKEETEKYSSAKRKTNKEMIGKENQIIELRKENAGWKEEADILKSEVGSLKTSMQKDTEMIEQLKQKTEELSRLLKEEREKYEKHRTTQAQKEMIEKEARSAQCPIEKRAWSTEKENEVEKGEENRSAQCPVRKEAWSAEKENELLSLRQQTKSHEDYVFALLKAKREKEEEISNLKMKVEQFERKFTKEAKQ